MSSPPVDPWSGQPERGAQSNSQPPVPPPPASWDRRPGSPEPQQGGWPPAPTQPRTPGTPPAPGAGPAGAWPPPPPPGWADPARPVNPPTAAWPNHPQPETPPTRSYPGTAPAAPTANWQPPADPWRPASGGGTPQAPSGGGWSAPQPRSGSQDEQPTQVYASFPPIPPADPPTSGPGYGQPTSGAPGYGQPTSGAPGYGQPTSGAPGYGQPTSGAPGYGQGPGDGPYGQPAAFPSGAETPAPGKRSRLPLVLSVGLVGLLVLCLGGGGLAYVALSGSDDPESPRAAAPSAGATPGAEGKEPGPSSEPSPDPQIRLVAPKSLGGRAKSTDPELKALADEMVRDMKSTVRSENSAIGAFYGSPEKENMVMIAGASGFVLDPKRELDDAVKALSSELSVRRMSTVSPGPLGGLAKCGDGSASEIPLGVCVWADQGSVGMIVMFFSSGSKAKAEFTSIRGQVEKRS